MHASTFRTSIVFRKTKPWHIYISLLAFLNMYCKLWKIKLLFELTLLQQASIFWGWGQEERATFFFTKRNVVPHGAEDILCFVLKSVLKFVSVELHAIKIILEINSLLYRIHTITSLHIILLVQNLKRSMIFLINELQTDKLAK